MYNNNHIKKMFKENWLSLGLAEINNKKNTSLELDEIIDLSFKSGIKMFDVAPNYYEGNAEKSIGNYIIKKSIKDLSIITKVGQLSNSEIYFRNKKHNVDDLTYFNFTPDYVKKSILRSLNNLNKKNIECVLIHNPEDAVNSKHSIYNLLSKIIPVLEEFCREKKIRCWGISSWSGFNSLSDDKTLFNIFELQEYIDNYWNNNHFQVLQVPLGFWNLKEFTKKNHKDRRSGLKFNLYEATKKLKLFLMVNSPFLGGDFFSDHKSFNNQNYSKEQMCLLYFKKMFPNITRIVGLRSRETIIEASMLL